MVLLILVLYPVIVALGVWCVWIAYQVRFKRRYTLVRDNNRQPLEQPELIADRFAIMVGSAGFAVLAFAASIIVYDIRFNTWPVYFAVIGGVLGVWRSFLLNRHARLLAASRPAA